MNVRDAYIIYTKAKMITIFWLLNVIDYYVNGNIPQVPITEYLWLSTKVSMYLLTMFSALTNEYSASSRQ